MAGKFRIVTSFDGVAQRSEIWRERPGTWLLNVGSGATHYMGDLSESGNLGHLRLGAAFGVALAYRSPPTDSPGRSPAILYPGHATGYAPGLQQPIVP